MSIKSIKEKQLLVNLAKSFGQEVDPLLLEEVKKHQEFENGIKESIRTNIFSDLNKALLGLKEEADRVSIENNFPLPPSLDDLESILEEESKPIEQASVPLQVKEQTITDLVASAISSSVKKESYKQPDPLLVEPDINAIQKKIKFLEQWIAKVSMAGPGSGETRFVRLDDVNKGSFSARDTHKILRYEPNANPAYDRVFFDNLSGDQGPIYSMKYDVTGYTSNANVGPGLTYYDPDRDTVEILHKDGNRTYTGLDNYIRVMNNGYSGNINLARIVEFSGADSNTALPLVRPLLNDSNTQPIYIVGVTANNIASNSIGRAMLLGELENIDTTGLDSGESWSLGDILWSKPGSGGMLTKYKPTAPNVVISVAAITRVDSSNGCLLVRPTIWPRLYYFDGYYDNRIIAASPSIDTKIPLSTILFTSGFVLNSNNIVALNSGLYKFDLRIQVSSSSSSEKSMIVWYKKNGINIPFSSVRQGISTNGGYASIGNLQIISMDQGDNVSMHFSVTDTTLYIDSPSIFDGAPNIASVQLNIFQAAL